jgi:DNA polymerase-3 subunit beta
MKATCMQENLARGLGVVGRAVATRSTLPVLSNILIETDDSRLKLSATNLEMGISCWVGARVDESGSVTVPARLLADFVNSLPQEQVSLELDDRTQTLGVSCDRFRANIKGIDASDFPILPTVEQGVRFTLDPEVLRDMIGQATIAAAVDESRPILTGVLTLISPDSGRLTMVAADGFRLSVCETDLAIAIDTDVSIIIPARALNELSRISADQDQPIEVAITDGRNQVLFKLNDIDLVSQLIEGSFPDYEKLMPTGYNTRTVVNAKELHNAVRIAGFFARDAANVVRLEFVPGTESEPGTVRVTAQAAEVGGNESELEASVDGERLEVAFNHKFLLDILAAIESDQVIIELTSSSSAVMFRPVGDSEFEHVIMPMHVGR